VAQRRLQWCIAAFQHRGKKIDWLHQCRTTPVGRIEGSVKGVAQRLTRDGPLAGVEPAHWLLLRHLGRQSIEEWCALHSLPVY
jgi:hypothetical protein